MKVRSRLDQFAARVTTNQGPFPKNGRNAPELERRGLHSRPRLPSKFICRSADLTFTTDSALRYENFSTHCRVQSELSALVFGNTGCNLERITNHINIAINSFPPRMMSANFRFISIWPIISCLVFCCFTYMLQCWRPALLWYSKTLNVNHRQYSCP